jgi:hypothetical protein
MKMPSTFMKNVQNCVDLWRGAFWMMPLNQRFFDVNTQI